MMFAHPGDSPPFATWIDTTTNTIKAQYAFTAALSGLEQCAYDPGTKSFYLNNDSTAANPKGQVDVFLASSVMTGTPALAKSYPLPLGKCNPTGLALGPGNDMLVACAPDAGDPLTSFILDRTNGNLVATVNLGGADQVAYDPVSNRYFMALRYWTNTGVSNLTPTYLGPTPQYTPILGVVDASSHAIVAKLPAGKNDHSVAVDGARHVVFVPHDSGGGSAFPTTGISIYTTM
jgi:hypothetical protein